MRNEKQGTWLMSRLVPLRECGMSKMTPIKNTKASRLSALNLSLRVSICTMLHGALMLKMSHQLDWL